MCAFTYLESVFYSVGTFELRVNKDLSSFSASFPSLLPFLFLPACCFVYLSLCLLSFSILFFMCDFCSSSSIGARAHGFGNVECLGRKQRRKSERGGVRATRAQVPPNHQTRAQPPDCKGGLMMLRLLC